jgi:hypothetical protein
MVLFEFVAVVLVKVVCGDKFLLALFCFVLVLVIDAQTIVSDGLMRLLLYFLIG